MAAPTREELIASAKKALFRMYEDCVMLQANMGEEAVGEDSREYEAVVKLTRDLEKCGRAFGLTSSDLYEGEETDTEKRA